jgi:hypothetical protein
MAKFTVPERYAAGLAAIRQLSDDKMREFLSALSAVVPSLDARAVVAAASSSAKSISQDELEQMTFAVVSLYAALDYSDFEAEPFAEEICLAMAESKRKDLTFDGQEDRKRFKDRLEKLLGIDSFGVASKALSLRREYDHIFCSGRILTDARPLYGTDVSVPPRAALILHTLRLAYHETNDLKEFYLTMDDSDLKELRDLLDRADLKGKSLTAGLAAAGIDVISAAINSENGE